MKIPKHQVETLRAAISPLDTDQARTAYRHGDFPRAAAVKDLDKRYRWDLFWAVGGTRVWADGDIPDGLLDFHIDTALRSIVAPL